MERAALVTGAATGIRLATAERLLRDGFALAYHSHREDGGQDRRQDGR